MSPLGDEEKAGIAQTIDEDVLKGTAIAFRSNERRRARDGALRVGGELELIGATRPSSSTLDPATTAASPAAPGSSRPTGA